MSSVVLRRMRFVASLIVLSGLSACDRDSGTGSGPDSPASFESDLPAGATGVDDWDSGGLHGQNASAPAASPSSRSAADADASKGESAGGDLARTISEADVIQLDGDRLYALSRIAGLAVIDVSDPTQLRMLGNYRQLNGTPFEMYLRGDTAIMMFSGWGEYVATEDGDYTFQQVSKIVALDVHDPAAMVTVGDFEVPGSIEDSRIVGDVLYVVGMEDGYCWRCERDKPATTISSLDVSNPSAIHQVDTLRYSDVNDAYSWKRSITVTDQRMYVAGPEYGKDGPTGSTIQVVDISDPGGDMVEAAVLKARGQISSRWQMDEYEGVLRVVSQPENWRVTEERPRVQTFQIVSSREIRALGSVDLVIPARETLRSARFDGPRGYVITAEQKDPLFTIDLSDPANPRQVGELVMPGFVYHMEPRGDRVLGLGFDQGNPEGSIAVSLFDVSDLAAPKMLSRVNFGGSWGWLPEDQDRIHKVWKVLTERNLLLVPFMGYQQIDGECGSKNIGGVQLVDYFADSDQLALRGSAKTEGEARRALIHRDHLFAVGDERVESFTISDRSKPRAAGRLILASPVVQVKQLDGGVVARIATSYSDGRQRVELVSAEHADDPNQHASELSLDELLGTSGGSKCESSAYIQSVHAQGDRLFVLYEQYIYDATKSENGQRRGVLMIDASDPVHPQVQQGLHWSTNDWSTYYDYYSYGGFGAQGGELWHGSVLALLEQRYEYRNQRSFSFMRLRVVDLRDPAAPRTSTLELPGGRQYSALIADGDRILTSHFQASADAASGRAKFYVDPFDISDPSAPKALDGINVPGALVHYDRASGRALTSQLRRVAAGQTTYEQCAKRFAQFDFDYGTTSLVDENSLGDCVGYRQSLHLVQLGAGGAVLEDTFTLDDDENVAAWSAGDGVLFATLGRGGYYRNFAGPAVDCFGPCGGYYPEAPQPVELLTLGNFGSGELAIGRLTVESDDDPWAGFWGSPPIHAYGTSALLISQDDVAIVDGSDPSAPRIERSEALLGSVQSVDIRDRRAAFALGERGVQFIDL